MIYSNSKILNQLPNVFTKTLEIKNILQSCLLP